MDSIRSTGDRISPVHEIENSGDALGKLKEEQGHGMQGEGSPLEEIVDTVALSEVAEAELKRLKEESRKS